MKRKLTAHDVSRLMAEYGRRGGRAAADRMTKADRRARAKKAVAAREAKRRERRKAWLKV